MVQNINLDWEDPKTWFVLAISLILTLIILGIMGWMFSFGLDYSKNIGLIPKI